MKIADRFIETKQNTNFKEYNDFEEYLKKTKQIVSQVQNTTLNIPFELKPEFIKKKGILLVHGLFDSPYGMKYLAEYFRQKGFLVRTILLPGHGTVPGDLLNIDYKEWIKAVEFGINSFKGEIENLYLAGLSVGAALCINSYIKNNRSIKGLFLFSPAVKLKQKILLSRLLKFLNRKWINKTLDTDPVRYESRPLNSVLQTIALLKKNELLLKKEPKIKVPLFVVLTADDETLDIPATISFFNSLKSRRISIFLYGENIKIKDPNIKILQSSYPEQNIISLSHSCLLISPDDPIYGLNGSYKPCSHYKDKNQFQRCQQDPNIVLGALTKKNIKKYPLIRKLTFNPGFNNILRSLDLFINTEI
jgi:esterase/lipase